jgi:hypothetical protein
MRCGIVDTKKEIFVGSEQLPDRKKPSLVVQRGNSITVLGYFTNQESADLFQKALFDIFHENDARGGWEG